MGDFDLTSYPQMPNMVTMTITAIWTPLPKACAHCTDVCIADCFGCACDDATPQCVSSGPLLCGRGHAVCPEGYWCRTAKNNYCDPAWNCQGECVSNCSQDDDCGASWGQACHAEQACLPGLLCVDDLRDDCTTACGDKDCPGVCIFPPELREG